MISIKYTSTELKYLNCERMLLSVNCIVQKVVVFKVNNVHNRLCVRLKTASRHHCMARAVSSEHNITTKSSKICVGTSWCFRTSTYEAMTYFEKLRQKIVYLLHFRFKRINVMFGVLNH